ncbi:trypsin-like serine protease [Streptosporangium soli]|nr:trypsin-like serine protease [Streptosporangium sp. KLBMP 9127]
MGAIVVPASAGAAYALAPSARVPSAVLSFPLAQSKAHVTAVEEFWKPDRLKKADDSTPKTADPKAEAASSAAAARSAGNTAATAVTAVTNPLSAALWTVQPALPTKKPATSTSPATVGKVYFRTGQKEYWCSATAVRAQSRSLVATAGHCAFDLRQNKAVDYWVFVPAYREGSQPEGIYVGHTLTMHTDYAKGDYDYDYAFITVHRGFKWEATKDAKGQSTYRKVDVGLLQDQVGGQGITAGRGASVAATAFGYPAGPQPDGSRPYNGHSLKSCAGQTRKVGSPTYLLDRGIAIKGCTFTAGASGGPWLIVYNPATGTGLLNGINSLSWNRKADGKNDEISSPYFNASTQIIYNYAQSLKAA